MSYTYDIRPSPNPQRGGWKLHLFENGTAAGLVDFPAEQSASAEIDAAKVAFERAEAEAKLWVKGRRVYSNRRRGVTVHPAALLLMSLALVAVLYNILKFVV